MEARNRKVKDWFGKIQRSEITLPRFQRYEAWDRYRICSLLETVVQDLPLGITLVLEVGEREQFVSRALMTADVSEDRRPFEQLLDGQQRLTALWRTMHNNYELETYYIYIDEFDDYDSDAEREDHSVFFKGRYMKAGERYPLWCDDPAKCLKRGFIPTHLLRPDDISVEVQDWISDATEGLRPTDDIGALEQFYERKQAVSDKINAIRSIIANYNLPYLSLPSSTEKSVALNVFINMNTNSKPLSMYDIIVAEVEHAAGTSLHDLLDELDEEHESVANYGELSDLVLNTSALLQTKAPNQKGAWDMDKSLMVENWPQLTKGLARMAKFLQSEGIFDRQRLPTNAVLAVIASLYEHVPESGDKLGRDETILRQYMWRSFFTDRYESAAATHAYSDFVGLRRLIKQENRDDGSPYALDDVPIFAEHELPEVEELYGYEWPKRATIGGRAVLAVCCRLGAMDFSTGKRLTADNIESRHYHHVFPDALLRESDIDGWKALNCALIADKTNMSIGRKEPLQYIKDRYEWSTEAVVSQRLESHLIPVKELATGGYEDLSDEERSAKVTTDYEQFIQARARLVARAMNVLCEGSNLEPSHVYSEASAL